MNCHSLVKFAVVTRSESHDRNDEISNSLNLPGTNFKEHVQKISNTLWPNCEHCTLMSFTGHCFAIA